MIDIKRYKEVFTQKECESLLGKDINFWSYYTSNCKSDLNKFHANIGVEQQKKLLVWCKKAEVLMKVFKDWDLVLQLENLDISPPTQEIIVDQEMTV